MHRLRRRMACRPNERVLEDSSDDSDSSDDIFVPLDESDSSVCSSNADSSSSSSSSSTEDENELNAWRARSNICSDSSTSSDETIVNDDIDSEDDDDDSDESEAPRSIKATRRALYHNNRFQSGLLPLMPPPSPPSERSTVETEDEGPLSPWNDKCKAKQKIITAMKNKESPIHNMLDDMEKLRQNYAPRYKLSKFKGYMKTIMKNYNEKKGPFKDEVEPWATRKKVKSKGYALLFTLLMNKETTGIDEVRYDVITNQPKK